MKNRRLAWAGMIFTLIFCLLFLTQCELILGNDGNANVGIDLSGLFGDGTGRAIVNPPPGVTGFTGAKITVFGPNMTPIVKRVSAGARFVNMYVPAGEDRHFTLEVFFSYDVTFPFPHLRSYKGRTITDLRPGMFVGLKFQMTAGASQLITPDCLNGDPAKKIWFDDGIQSMETASGNLGYAGTLRPVDIELTSDGGILCANAFDTPNLVIFSSDYLGTRLIPIPNLGSQPVQALAMDRNAGFNIDRNIDPPSIDYDVLYYCNLTTGAPPVTNNFGYVILDHINDINPPATYPAQALSRNGNTGGMAWSITAIRGMSVDPWTHRLFLVGVLNNGEALIEYDPFYADPPDNPKIRGRALRWIFNPDFLKLNDVIVKDEGIYALNETNTDFPDLPCLFRYDRNLNYVSDYGRISLGVSGIEPSTAAGNFYYPMRFIAQENDGLYIIDDSNQVDFYKVKDYDKVIFINTNLDSASWRTYPPIQPVMDSLNRPTTGENFSFFKIPQF